MAELNDGGNGASLEVLRDGPTTILKLGGELDLASADRIERLAADVVEAVEERLVVDAGGLRFADSSALALWVKWRRAVPSLEVRNPPAAIRRVIETMGLAEVLGVS